jgi:ankyrin repeat protein
MVGSLRVLRAFASSGGDLNEPDDSQNSCYLIHQAILGNQLGTVKWLIAQAVELDVSNQDGIQPLHLCCLQGNIEILKLLLDAGADPLARNKYGRTPLHFACIGGHLTLVRYLVEVTKLSIFDFDEVGRTALHFACMYGHEKLSLYLVKHGAASLLEVKSPNCPSPRQSAAKHSAKFERILQQASSSSRSSMDHQNQHHSNTMLPFSSDPVASMDISGLSAQEQFLMWVKGGCFDHMKRCREMHITSISLDACNEQGMNALHLAVVGCHDDIVRYLLLAGAAPEITQALNGLSALHMASEAGNVDIVTTLLSFGASVDGLSTCGRTPSHYAAAQGHVAVLEVLLAWGASLTVTIGQEHQSLLYAATINGEIAAVVFLHARGLSLHACGQQLGIAEEQEEEKEEEKENIKAKEQEKENVKEKEMKPRTMSALWLAVAGGHGELVTWLLLHGAWSDISPELLVLAARTDTFVYISEAIESIHGLIRSTALVERANDVELLVSLLTAGEMQCPAVDARGNSLLHTAVKCGNQRIANLLLSKSSSSTTARDSPLVHGCNAAGQTPLHFACMHEHELMAQVLVAHGADPDKKDAFGVSPASLLSPEAVRRCFAQKKNGQSILGDDPSAAAVNNTNANTNTNTNTTSSQWHHFMEDFAGDAFYAPPQWDSSYDFAFSKQQKPTHSQPPPQQKDATKPLSEVLSQETDTEDTDELRWKELVELSTRDNVPITYAMIPWPVGSVCVIPPGLGKNLARKRLQRAYLRWHPDKFEQAWGRRLHEPDRERILRKVKDVAQTLSEVYVT